MNCPHCATDDTLSSNDRRRSLRARVSKLLFPQRPSWIDGRRAPGYDARQHNRGNKIIAAYQ